MGQYKLKEYTQKEYEADMRKLLAEKGLHDAVKVFCDKIEEDASCLSYLGHRSIQEFMNDILFLIDLDKEKMDKIKKIINATEYIENGVVYSYCYNQDRKVEEIKKVLEDD